MKMEVVEDMVASVEGNGRKGGRDEGIVSEGGDNQGVKTGLCVLISLAHSTRF